MISFFLTLIWVFIGSFLIVMSVEFFVPELHELFYTIIPHNIPKFLENYMIITGIILFLLGIFFWTITIRFGDRIFKEDIQWWYWNYCGRVVIQIVSFIILYNIFIIFFFARDDVKLYNIIITGFIFWFISLKLSALNQFIRRKKWKGYKL